MIQRHTNDSTHHHTVEHLSLDVYKNLLPKRPPTAHKGNFGHVGVIGGDYGFLGAVQLAGESALRIGAGLTTIFTRPEHAPLMSIARPELMAFGISDATALVQKLARITVILIGSGLGQDLWSRQLLVESMQYAHQHTLPMVFDADALNLLSALSENTLPSPSVITPHPGEAARLLDTTSEHIQKNRMEAACALVKKFNCVVVLKGANTLIAAPNQTMRMYPVANPALATAGTGDVLSGLIAGLIAQHVSSFDAATAAVSIHATAASGYQRGLLAGDLLKAMTRLLQI